MRIVHLGLGAFHRAHQAVFLQRLIDGGDSRWHIAAGNISPGQEAVEAALVAQAGAYTVESVAPDGRAQYQRVRSIRSVLPYEPGLARLIELGASPGTRIVSFTVTEAGYAPGPTNALYPALAAMLRERRRANAGKLTLLCCDNLRQNGQVARAGLLAFLAGDAALRDWVLLNTSWPNCMVDRITPRPPPALRSRVLAATDHEDAAAVTAESWLQWAIEDDFCNGRPAWEQVGVQMVDDVGPYEEAKIRILNAGHSAIAWAGTLLGHRFIHEAALDPRIRRIAHAYITAQVIPCLQAANAAGSPLDLEAYRDSVLERFGNAALADSCRRVIADSWAKLPGFIVPTLRERLAAGADIASGALLPALMLAVLQRWHVGALDEPYEDSAMDPQAAHALCAAVDPVAAFAAVEALWGDWPAIHASSPPCKQPCVACRRSSPHDGDDRRAWRGPGRRLRGDQRRQGSVARCPGPSAPGGPCPWPSERAWSLPRRLKGRMGVNPGFPVPQGELPVYYKHHFFVCLNQRANGEACCADHDAQAAFDHCKARVKELGIAGKGGVRVNKSGCLDRCAGGPVAVVYPEGVWYSWVDQNDLDEIVDSHLRDGRVVERLVLPDSVGRLNAQTEKRLVPGPAGQIEIAIDLPPAGAAPLGTALICHPNPTQGGTMDNKVVQTVARAFLQLGWRTVRFNFRGIGQSQGGWDHGRGEVDDALAVLAAVRTPGEPLVLAGFSFGGYVASRAAQSLAEPAQRLVLVGPATSRFDCAPVPADTVVIHGEVDDVVPLAAVLDWARPQSLPVTVVPGVGHFFHGQLPLLKSLVVRAFDPSRI